MFVVTPHLVPTEENTIMAEEYNTSILHHRRWYSWYLATRNNGTQWGGDSRGIYQGESWLNGYKNPKWRDQVRLGYQAGTEMSAQQELHGRLPYYEALEQFAVKPPYTPSPYWLSSKYSTATFHDTWLDSHSPESLSETKANNEALTHYVNKIRDVQTSFQGGVFLGELKEAVDLIRNPVKSIRDGVSSFLDSATKRNRTMRNLTSARKRDILADSWLEYSFGWKPFVNDLAEGLETFANANNDWDKSGWKTVYGVGEDEIPIYKGQVTLGTSTPSLRTNLHRKSKVIVKYKGQVDRSLNAVYDAQNMGLDLHSVPLAAWEIVPWSFLIDYFTNFGDIISAASLARSDVRWTLKTVRKEYISELKGKHMTLTVNATNKYQKSWLSMDRFIRRPMVRKHVYRTPYNGSLVPQLEFSIPGGASRWLNMAALYTGRKNLKAIYLT